jgi:hypothetical protein
MFRAKSIVDSGAPRASQRPAFPLVLGIEAA